jgi:hypothetical protein
VSHSVWPGISFFFLNGKSPSRQQFMYIGLITHSQTSPTEHLHSIHCIDSTPPDFPRAGGMSWSPDANALKN